MPPVFGPVAPTPLKRGKTRRQVPAATPPASPAPAATPPPVESDPDAASDAAHTQEEIDEAREEFESIDANKDGWITREEIMQAFMDYQNGTLVRHKGTMVDFEGKDEL